MESQQSTAGHEIEEEHQDATYPAEHGGASGMPPSEKSILAQVIMQRGERLPVFTNLRSLQALSVLPVRFIPEDLHKIVFRNL